MQEGIPNSLMSVEETVNFLAWLLNALIHNEDKRYLLIFWADRVGTAVTSDMIARAGIK